MRVSSASASIAKMLVFTGMISLAVMPQAVDAFSGSLSWFDTETGNAGACGSFSRNSDYIVALSENYVNRNGPLRNVCYNSICIRYRDRVVQAAIYDLCPDNGCTGDGLDATPSLFQALTGDLGIGRTSIEWWFANNGGCGSAPEPPRPSPRPPAPSPQPPAPSPRPPAPVPSSVSSPAPAPAPPASTSAATTELTTSSVTTSVALPTTLSQVSTTTTALATLTTTTATATVGYTRGTAWPTAPRSDRAPLNQRSHCLIKSTPTTAAAIY